MATTRAKGPSGCAIIIVSAKAFAEALVWAENYLIMSINVQRRATGKSAQRNASRVNLHQAALILQRVQLPQLPHFLRIGFFPEKMSAPNQTEWLDLRLPTLEYTKIQKHEKIILKSRHSRASLTSKGDIMYRVLCRAHRQVHGNACFTPSWLLTFNLFSVVVIVKCCTKKQQ